MNKYLFPILTLLCTIGCYFVSSDASLAILPALLGGIGSIGSSIIGSIGGSGARDEAKQFAMKAFEEYEKLGMPPDMSYPIILEELKSQGLYEPELEEAINLGISKVSEIKEDPGLRDAQMNALGMLKDRASQGYTAQERAAVNKARSLVNQDVQGKLGQIQQNMQARGQGGSGAELAAQLSASQEGARRASEESDRISADAAANALSAMSQYGSLGGQVRGQDFDINQTKAEAADLVNRFNTEQAMNRQQRNVLARQQAQQLNLEEKQRIADYNSQLRNAEKMRQQEAKRQNFQDKAALASGKANALNSLASRQDNEASAVGQQWQNIGSGIGAIGTSIYDNQLKERDREDRLRSSVQNKGLLGAYRK